MAGLHELLAASPIAEPITAPDVDLGILLPALLVLGGAVVGVVLEAALPKAAVGATRRLLRELDEGRYADSLWQKVRVELLASPERRSLVAAARQRHVPSASSRPTE